MVVKANNKPVVKINNQPVQVRQEDDKNKIDWFYLSVCGTGTLLALWFLDCVAAMFVGTHPFPWTQWISVVFSWFS